jgi:hypothetical protein
MFGNAKTIPISIIGKASVVRAKYEPRNLRQGIPIINPIKTAAIAPNGIVITWGRWACKFKRPATYAAVPKKRAWPKFICPVNPDNKSQLADKTAKILLKIRILSK